MELTILPNASATGSGSQTTAHYISHGDAHYRSKCRVIVFNVSLKTLDCSPRQAVNTGIHAAGYHDIIDVFLLTRRSAGLVSSFSTERRQIPKL